MDGEPEEQALSAQEAPLAPAHRWRRRLWRWPLALLGFFAALLVVGVIVLNSSIGHRFVTDRIAALAPASGLRVSIGRIDGSLYGAATLHNVTLSDKQGPFLRVPLVDLDWRPYHWFTSGLDVRKLITHRGVLMRAPKLEPGNPNAPILPNFDIRIDRFEVQNLTVSQGVFGEARKLNLVAKTDIRKGKVYLKTEGRLATGDHLYALINAQPDRDIFDVNLDYNAPKGGLLATVFGAKESVRARLAGRGKWSAWKGGLLVDRGGGNVAALRFTNRAGNYSILGLVHPQDMLTGIPRRVAGNTVALGATGTLVNSVLKGSTFMQGSGLFLDGKGTIDLGNNAVHDLHVGGRVRDPALLGAGTRLEGARFAATLDGAFRNLTVEHSLSVDRLASGSLVAEGVTDHGTAGYDGVRWVVPLDLRARRIVTGNATIDPRLQQARVAGTLTIVGNRLTSDNLAVAVPGIAARFALRGDMARGGYGLAGPVQARGVAVPNLGVADADATIRAEFGAAPWTLDAQVKGRMTRVTNPTLTSLAGTGIRFSGNLSLGGARPLLFQRATLSGSKLVLGIAGRYLPNGTTTVAGSGRQADYGPFTVQATFAGDGPHAELMFADPYPSAGLKNVHVALSPIAQGFRIVTSGDSMLGPFTGTLGLFSHPGGPTRLEIERLNVWKTSVTGSLALGNAVSGQLKLTGGGIDGTIHLAPRGGGQGFDVALTADHAQFGGATPISVVTGRLAAQGVLRKGHSTISGNVYGQGISSGSLFIGRVAANATLVDGRGRVTASLAGRRGSRFALQVLGDVAPGRIAVAAQGDIAGARITMPRRAVLTSEHGGWRLAPTELDYAGGKVIASGLLGGGGTQLNLALAGMPLAVTDIFMADMGLGGKISGLVDFHQPSRGLPTGSARVKVTGLTRSGLVLTSRPVDLALVGTLTASTLETRAVVTEGGAIRGRLQGRITGMARSGSLIERLSHGNLFAQLRYTGPADALWRLAAVDAFDLTGPIEVAADVTGSVADPTIRGSVASQTMRLQSGLIGADVRNIVMRGSFSGSRLQLTSFTGTTPDNGRVIGNGTVDLSGLGTRGPAMDLRLSAHNARLINRYDMSATVTGPLRIVSDGIAGTIAGRVSIDKASWHLGVAASAEKLPDIKVREINSPADIAPPAAASAPWRLLIDASGGSRIDVKGLGLDSEWGADLKLRGTTSAPTILGQADMIRGGYDFAGKRFDLTRGRVNFDGNTPVNPRLDITAEADLPSLTARVSITGTSLHPEINFTSTPSLPEEELVSRILFGNGITDLSTPEALQLGAALAAMRGGGGMDPINKLRSAIGLDQLRIVPADATLGRGTSVAVGKNIGRKFYAEIITDGQGYSATQLEYRITRWLSLLATVSTVGHNSVNVQVRKDY